MTACRVEGEVVRVEQSPSGIENRHSSLLRCDTRLSRAGVDYRAHHSSSSVCLSPVLDGNAFNDPLGLCAVPARRPNFGAPASRESPLGPLKEVISY